MENTTNAAGAISGRREPSIDRVKAQGILASIVKKEKYAQQLWKDKWVFLTQIRQVQEEEAQKLGMSLDEYRAAVRSVSCQPVPKECIIGAEPSPTPLPLTSSGIIGRRAQCQLERYSKIVKTDRDYLIRPPLKPNQVYDPYKQTLIFLGSVAGDPISYKLPPSRSEVTDAMWACPQSVHLTPINWGLEHAFREGDTADSE